MSASPSLRRLAASTALVAAAAFAPLAHAGEALSPACAAAQKNTGPLLSDNNAANCYTAMFSRTLRAAATGEVDAGTPARAFMYNLNNALEGKAVDVEAKLTGGVNGASRTLVYPSTGNTDFLVIAAVIPPAGHETAPIAVCAQKNGRVVGAWDITNKGLVVPRPALQNSAGSTSAACTATIVAARQELNSLTQNTPAQGGSK